MLFVTIFDYFSVHFSSFLMHFCTFSGHSVPLLYLFSSLFPHLTHSFRLVALRFLRSRMSCASSASAASPTPPPMTRTPPPSSPPPSPFTRSSASPALPFPPSRPSPSPLSTTPNPPLTLTQSHGRPLQQTFFSARAPCTASAASKRSLPARFRRRRRRAARRSRCTARMRLTLCCFGTRRRARAAPERRFRGCIIL